MAGNNGGYPTAYRTRANLGASNFVYGGVGFQNPSTYRAGLNINAPELSIQTNRMREDRSQALARDYQMLQDQQPLPPAPEEYAYPGIESMGPGAYTPHPESSLSPRRQAESGRYYPGERKVMELEARKDALGKWSIPSNDLPDIQRDYKAQLRFAGALLNLFKVHPWIRLLFTLAQLAYGLADLFQKWFGNNRNMTGWTRNCGNTIGAMLGDTLPCGGFFGYTKINYAARLGTVNFNGFVSSVDFVAFKRQHSAIPGNWELIIGGNYTKAGAQPVPFPGSYPSPGYSPFGTPENSIWKQPIPTPFTGVDPFDLPIGKPVDPSETRQLPWRVIPYRNANPFYSPGEQPYRTYGTPQPQRKRITLPLPVPGVAVQPGDNVEPLPQFEITSSGVKIKHPSRSLPRPPKRGEKERKVILAVNQRKLYMRILNFATEANDVIEAIYDALPKEYKLKVKTSPKDKFLNAKNPSGRFVTKPTPQAQLQQLYKHWDKVDLNQAFDNLVKNEIKDRFFGKIGQAAGRASRAAGMSHGIQLGPGL